MSVTAAVHLFLEWKVSARRRKPKMEGVYSQITKFKEYNMVAQ